MSSIPSLWHAIEFKGSNYLLGLKLNDTTGDSSKKKDGLSQSQPNPSQSQETYFLLILTDLKDVYVAKYKTKREFMKLGHFNGIDFLNRGNVSRIIDFFHGFNNQLIGVEISRKEIKYDVQIDQESSLVTIKFNGLSLKIPLEQSSVEEALDICQGLNAQLWEYSAKILKFNKKLVSQIKLKDQLIKFLLDDIISSDINFYQYSNGSGALTDSMEDERLGKSKRRKLNESYLSNPMIKSKIPDSLKNVILGFDEQEEFDSMAKISSIKSNDVNSEFGATMNWNDVMKWVDYGNKLYLRSIQDDQNDSDTFVSDEDETDED